MSRRLEFDGLPIVDSKHPVKLSIMPEDIKTASVKRPDDCAIARACRRNLGAIEVRVHLSRVYLRANNSNWQRYELPNSLHNELIAFDRGGRFQPGEFILKPIRPSSRTGKQQGGKTTSATNRTGKKRRPYHLVTDVRTGPA